MVCNHSHVGTGQYRSVPVGTVLLDARSGAWTRAHCNGQHGPVLISTAHKVAYSGGCRGSGQRPVPVSTGWY
jgi:hypothetical protein